MIIEVPISIGELIDKITILKIKVQKIEDKQKAHLARQELHLLEQKLLSLPGGRNQFEKEEESLFQINSILWEVEDLLREKELNQVFDEEFTELARQVYKTNDRRFQVKNDINLKAGSAVREVKSYKDYDRTKS